jgi:hypothetical protein
MPCDPSGKELCMKCQVTGECKNSCKHADTHKMCGPDIIREIHNHLTKCGVAL